MERVKCNEDFLQFSNIKSSQILENFSNEIIYEIFDYLHGYDIYKAFSNLNKRLENLLNNSSFLMKIQFSSEIILDSHYKHFLDSNKHHIISFDFPDEPMIDKFLSFYIINSSFNRLQSLIFNQISTFKLVIYLFYLKSLPCLSSLTINLIECYDNLGDIYQMIFHLPYLKYLNMEICESEQLDLDISIPNDENLSSIEYFVLNHCCTLNEITNLLLYTPKLTHLICASVIEIEDDIKSDVLIQLNHLINLKIQLNDVAFNNFDEFLMKLSSKLEILNLTTENWDKDYLDVDRWERFISSNLIYLKEFHFSYIDFIYDLEVNPYYSLINRFTSTFWIEHQWIFQILIEDIHISYLIRPQKTLKYNFQEHNDQILSGAYFIGDGSLRTLEKPLSISISSILKLIKITCLDIKCSKTSLDIFIKLLNLLPNLIAIRLLDLPSDQEIQKFNQNTEDFKEFLKTNKITKITLQNPNEIQINFIINFFHHLQSFALQNIYDRNLQLIVRYTLLKIKQNNICHPMIFCIFDLKTEENIIKKLQEIINEENLLEDYTINQRLNRFYIQWK